MAVYRVTNSISFGSGEGLFQKKHAAEAVTLTGPLLKATIVGALGGLLFGFDTAVISGTTASLTQKFALTPWTLGVTVFLALGGTIAGAMCAGIPGQKWGAREPLRVLAAFYLVSALGCAFAWNWEVLLLARFTGGLGIGGSSVLGPVYIAELAPAKVRGRLVGTFQNQHRGRNSAGLPFQFRDCADGVRCDRMALAVWRSRTAGCALLDQPVRNSR